MNPRDNRLNQVISFADCNATAVLPWKYGEASKMIELHGVKILATSERRDTFPVTVLGKQGIKGLTYGHSITAGTLGFNVFLTDPFWDIIVEYAKWLGDSVPPESIRPHQLPPFDLILTYVTPTKTQGAEYIRGLKIVDSSENISIDTVNIQVAYSFIAMSKSTLVASDLNSLDLLMNKNSESINRAVREMDDRITNSQRSITSSKLTRQENLDA